jgi:uncharacterized phage protein (TIGR02216 family)
MSGEPAPFPWDAVLHAAFRHLRWTPDTVWRATPRELAIALRDPDRVSAPMRRDAFAALLDAFPDEPC